MEKWKRPACLEGAEWAYASAMAHFPKIKPLDITSEPLARKDQTLEEFLAQVHEGARVTEAQCSKAALKF